jgi:hypothetical protein
LGFETDLKETTKIIPEINYFNFPITKSIRLENGGTIAGGSAHFWGFFSNFKVRFKEFKDKKIQPFLTGGPGLIMIRESEMTIDGATHKPKNSFNFALNFGVGIDISVADKYSLWLGGFFKHIMDFEPYVESSRKLHTEFFQLGTGIIINLGK